MMRNIIAITVLFSLIVTFADFDIVRILTAGGPQDMTHVFATYAFQVGIQSGDIPLGAADSLFMFPILAFAAFFVLRGVTQAHQGDRGMSATVAERRRQASPRRADAQPAPAAALGAVGQLYRAGRVRGDVPGAAVLHADDQPEIVGGDLGAGGQPVDRAPPDAGEFLVPDHLSELPDLLPELGDRHGADGRHHHGDLGAGGVQPGAHGVLGQPDAVDRRVPHLPGPAVAAVHPVVPDRRLDRPDQQLLVPGAAVSDPGGAVLHLDHDRLFQFHPEGTG